MRRSKIECEPLILIYVQVVVLAQHGCDTGSDTGDHSLTGTRYLHFYRRLYGDMCANLKRVISKRILGRSRGAYRVVYILLGAIRRGRTWGTRKILGRIRRL